MFETPGEGYSKAICLQGADGSLAACANQRVEVEGLAVGLKGNAKEKSLALPFFTGLNSEAAAPEKLSEEERMPHLMALGILKKKLRKEGAFYLERRGRP